MAQFDITITESVEGGFTELRYFGSDPAAARDVIAHFAGTPVNTPVESAEPASICVSDAELDALEPGQVFRYIRDGHTLGDRYVKGSEYRPFVNLRTRALCEDYEMPYGLYVLEDAAPALEYGDLLALNNIDALPVGSLAEDGDEDEWVKLENGNWTMTPTRGEGTGRPGRDVLHYAPLTLVRLGA